MGKTKSFKPLSELTLLDRFLFNTVMEYPENARDILSIILGHDVGPVKVSVSERTVQPYYDARAIRLDLLSVSEDDTVFDAEAQQENIGSGKLRRRSRYYQSVLDASLLVPGETNFAKLPDVYIIFIAPFDIFAKGKYCYTFRMMCEEVSDLAMEDGAIRLFLNTRGNNDSEVPAELIDFLHMAEKTFNDDDHETHSDRVSGLIDRIKLIKNDQEVGVHYMKYLEEIALERKEACDAQLLEIIKGMLKEGLDTSAISRITKKTPEEIERLIGSISEE